MKKKLLFILNTYDFMIDGNFKNYKINKIYKLTEKKSSSWINDFCEKLKKDYKVSFVYPKINQKYILNQNYEDILTQKIIKLKPDLIYCNFLDYKIEKLLSKIKKIKKIIWLSVKTSEKKIIHLKNSYDFIMSGNQNILRLAKKNKFKNLELLISSPFFTKVTKKKFIERNKNIYFSGSLGNDFKYRLEVLQYIGQKFKTKLRIRNLVEKYYILQIFNNKLMYFFPKIASYLYQKKILPVSNNLKYLNNDEIFGKKLLKEMSKYQFAINVHSNFDQNNNINSRVYEALSCGCLLFCEENKYMRKIFLQNKHVVYFNSLEDLEKKLNFYKQNQDKAFLISKSGNLHFNRYHTSTQRIKKFKKIINKIIN